MVPDAIQQPTAHSFTCPLNQPKEEDMSNRPAVVSQATAQAAFCQIPGCQ